MAKSINLPINGKGSQLNTTDELKAVSETWERVKGSRVREYLQKKVGATYRPDARQDDNAYHLLSFETTETRDEWVEKWQAASDASDTDAMAALWKSDLIIDDTSLGGNTDIQNSVELISGSNQSSIVSTDGTLKIKLRFTSIEYNPVTQKTQDTGESATLVIERRANSNSNWTRVASLDIPSINIDETDSYTEIDLSDILPNGTWQLRCTATGQVTEMTTSAVQFGSVIKTKLVLESKTAWQYPNTTSDVTLSYAIQGAVAKTLYYALDGAAEATGSIPIGTTEYTETTRDITISGLSHGVHNIRAWLGVDGTDTKSEEVNTQIMVVTDSTNKNILLVVNEVADTVVNYVQSKIFGYAIYNPNTDGTDISFKITDYRQTTTYASNTDKDVKNGDQMTYSNTLEIESQETSLDAYIHIYDADGNELRDAIGFKVDNSQNFAPTSNADFILNPKTRSNNDNPESIINAADGSTVAATFSNFGFATDGWVTDDNGVKCLRVPSGSEVNIDYEPLSQFANSGNHTASLTMEFDIATRNIVDEDAALLKVCSYNSSNNNPLGFELKPLEACFMTSALQTKRDQDIMFQDKTRTHIAVNIVYNLSSSGVNYIRIFVNGVINREMQYQASDSFLQYVNNVLTSQGIRIGAVGADIDIYGIRIYKRALSAANIRQDYIASLETTEEKLAFREANDILGDGNLIDYTKAHEKYNTLLWTGSIPSYSDNNKQIGDIDIHIVGDKAHSGVMKNVQLKGQGTSSMSYWKWNGQFKTSYEKDGEEIETDWIDENGVSHGAGYQLEDGLPMATKLVWKINWASPQQSHKLGSVNLFTDLWKQVVGGNGITNYTDADGNKPYANCRVSTIQKPFMLFTRATENSTPVFYALVTFGPGKADKPTFGYYKKVLPDFVMVEGSENGAALPEHRVPWDDEVRRVEDDGDILYYYGKGDGSKQIEIDMGLESMVDQYFKPAANFVFLHNLNIQPYVGTYESMITDSSIDIKTQYWVTADSTDGSHHQFDLFRWDYVTETWVNASTTKTNNVYDVLNLHTQTNTGTGNDWDSINKGFIAWRTSDFKKNLGKYYNTNDLLYCMQFCKLIGASDNRCKNTYAYIDPVSHLICFMQDDLDTIFATDNVGRKNKPYYVEEHDLDDSGNNYWNGTDNVLYNTVEAAFADELRATMNSILAAMATLSGSPTKCVEEYYFAVQKYFPAVAYNEAARLLYEEAQAAQNNGNYSNGTPPITQSLGDQLQAEQEWWKRREVYISSYAGYGQFGARDNASGSDYLMFRSILTNEDTPQNPQYQFVLTPAIWLYPSIAVGQTGYDGTTRVKAGEAFTTSLVSADGNTNIYIRGINYFKSIGVFGNKSIGEAFSMSADKLIEFDASKPDDMLEQFRPSSFALPSIPLMQTLDLEGAETILGSLDLSNLTKLETVNLKSTGVTSVTLPETRTLKSVSLPAVQDLAIANVPNLTSFTLQDVTNLQTIEVGENVGSGFDVKTILANLNTAKVQIGKLTLTGIEWSSCAATIIDYIANITNCNITGHIVVNGLLSLATITKLTSKFGDITDSNNSLYIEYSKNAITSVVVTGSKYLDTVGNHQMGYTILPTNGNNVKSMKWSISESSYATIDENTGIVNVTQLGNEDAQTKATVTLTIELTDGTQKVATKDVYLYKHTLQLGDIVFADGTYSDEGDSEKTAVGVCFYKDDNIRLMVGLKDIATDMWGLYNDSSRGVADVALSDVNYDAYDTPVTNIASHGLSSGNNITDALYYDSDAKKFIEFPNTVGLGQLGSIQVTQAMYNSYQLYFQELGINVGDKIAYGQYFTVQIIAHRDKVLQDSNINLEVPASQDGKSENTRLTELIASVISAHENKNVYRQFYYPVASRCYAYQPVVKDGETLKEEFTAHHWFLPSIGELGRLYFYKSHGYTASDTDENVIFDKANGALGFSMGTYWDWASTEYSGDRAWYLGFSDGNFSNYGYGKNGSNVVRCVCAF